MEEEKNNSHFTSEYIRKYLDGQLDGPEMQALEKAALEDPFLADAIEGYQESLNHPVSFESQLESLQKNLTDRVQKKDRKTGIIGMFSKWKIAASILFIVGTTFFTIKFLTNKDNKEKLADQAIKDSSTELNSPVPAKKKTDTMGTASLRSQTENSGSDTAGEPSQVKKEKQNAVTGKSNLSAVRKRNPSGSDKKAAEVSYPDFSKDQPEKVPEKTAAPLPSRAKNNEIPTPGPGQEERDLNETPSVAIEKNKSFSEDFIQGVVVDDKGKPIPFTAVTLKGSNRRTLTDTAGFFKLYMKNPRLASLVFTDPAGHEPMSAELLPDSIYTNRFQLHESETSLNEVAVSASDTAIGWQAFYNYINDNKKILTADSVLKGNETISFLVHPDERLSSFRVEKSISPSHDTEILRLIKSAPPLKITEGKKQRCRINISFK
jgi:hypothetical protein